MNTDVGGPIHLGVDSLSSGILWSTWNEVSFAPSPLPASASQVIVDVFPHSYEAIAHNLCILDPNQIPAGVNPITTCQGQQMLNASALPGANGQYAWANYRIEANLDANRDMWFGADGALQGFGTLFYFIAVYMTDGWPPRKRPAEFGLGASRHASEPGETGVIGLAGFTYSVVG